MEGFWLGFIVALNLAVHELVAADPEVVQVSAACNEAATHCLVIFPGKTCDLSPFESCIRANCTEAEYNSLTDIMCFKINLQQKLDDLRATLRQPCMTRLNQGGCMANTLQGGGIKFMLDPEFQATICAKVQESDTKECFTHSDQGCNNTEYKSLRDTFCNKTGDDDRGLASGLYAPTFLVFCSLTFVLGLLVMGD